MKKFFTTLLMAATLLAVGCNETETPAPETETPTYVGVKYDGTLSVSENSYSQDASVYVDMSNDEQSVTITLAKVAFDAAMIPFTGYLDIVVKDVPEGGLSGGYTTPTTTTYNLYGEDIGYTFTDVSVTTDPVLVTFGYSKTNPYTQQTTDYTVTFSETQQRQ